MRVSIAITWILPIYKRMNLSPFSFNFNGVPLQFKNLWVPPACEQYERQL